MQIATSILSPAKFNLIVTFKHFSDDFKFDLCHDFSFWQAESRRCIPKEMYEDETLTFYIFPPLCNRTEFDCRSPIESFRKYCPNKDESCERYDKEKYFFCNESKTCIPKGKLI